MTKAFMVIMGGCKLGKSGFKETEDGMIEDSEGEGSKEVVGDGSKGSGEGSKNSEEQGSLRSEGEG